MVLVPGDIWCPPATTVLPVLVAADLDVSGLKRLLTRDVEAREQDPVGIAGFSRFAEVLHLDSIGEGAGAVDRGLTIDGCRRRSVADDRLDVDRAHFHPLPGSLIEVLGLSLRAAICERTDVATKGSSVPVRRKYPAAVCHLDLAPQSSGGKHPPLSPRRPPLPLRSNAVSLPVRERPDCLGTADLGPR